MAQSPEPPCARQSCLCMYKRN